MLKISIETLNKRTYEKVTFYHLFNSVLVCYNCKRQEAKGKIVWPKAVLTLKDGTVLNGYLRTDIHFMQKCVLFSETEEGKNVKYKNETIKSLVVKNCFGDGKEATFIPIKLYWSDQKK